MAHDVFISHSAKDKAVADAACAALERASVRCWIAPRDVRPGADWASSIVSAINSARAMVLVFSGHANESAQIAREVSLAFGKGMPVIPLRIENVKPSGPFEYYLNMPHWLDAMTPPLERHLDRLVETIRQILATRYGESDALPIADDMGRSIGGRGQRLADGE